ncbi:MAG TPA: co-chaperone GroES [bacterium]|nr:co-chaperone GroES [bacterium]
MNVKPLADRVVIKALDVEKEVKKGGIIIPDTAKEKPQEGEVVEVGPGRKNEDGKLIPLEVKKGDRVLYGKYSGTEVTIDDQEYLIMREADILAVVANGKH